MTTTKATTTTTIKATTTTTIKATTSTDTTTASYKMNFPNSFFLNSSLASQIASLFQNDNLINTILTQQMILDVLAN